MSVEMRMKWALYATLGILLPAFINLIKGRLDPLWFGIYFFVVFIVAWIGVSILNKVIVMFAFEAARNQIERLGPAKQRRRPERRAAQSAAAVEEAAPASLDDSPAES